MLSPKSSSIGAEVAQDMGFAREFPKSWRIGEYGRLQKYSMWYQEISEIGPNL